MEMPELKFSRGLVLEPPFGSRLHRLCLQMAARPCWQGVVLEPKRSRWYWRVLSVFSRRWYNRTTAIYPRIGLSDEAVDLIEKKPPGWDDRIWSLLLHELDHIEGQFRIGTVFWLLLYLLVFFPVLLAYFRARFERRGFRWDLLAMVVLKEIDPNKPEVIARWWVDLFAGKPYAYAFPFRRRVRKWLDDDLQRIKKGTFGAEWISR